MPNAHMDTALLNRWCYTSKYNAKTSFHAYDTRIYTLRFHFQWLFDTFDTFSPFKCCIMPQDNSIAMIKITKLSI